MKKLILGLILVMGAMAHAQQEVVLSQKTVQLPVSISESTVKLSTAGYRFPTVKVLIPALADVTLLNHRNFGEGAPCMATSDTKDPEKVIANHPGEEVIPVEVTLIKRLSRYFPRENSKEMVCRVYLTEQVQTVIRGFKFVHERSTAIGDRALEDCR